MPVLFCIPCYSETSFGLTGGITQRLKRQVWMETLLQDEWLSLIRLAGQMAWQLITPWKDFIGLMLGKLCSGISTLEVVLQGSKKFSHFFNLVTILSRLSTKVLSHIQTLSEDTIKNGWMLCLTTLTIQEWDFLWTFLCLGGVMHGIMVSVPAGLQIEQFHFVRWVICVLGKTLWNVIGY